MPQGIPSSSKPNQVTVTIQGVEISHPDLGIEMNWQIDMVTLYYLEQRQHFDWSTTLLEIHQFFDKNPDRSEDLICSFVPIWRATMDRGRNYAAIEIWSAVIQMTIEWEKSRQGRIYKGTAYYFWACTEILTGDLESGFHLMHRAYKEDQDFTGERVPKTPARAFVVLDPFYQNQFFKKKVEQYAQFVDDALDEYRNTRRGTITLQQIREQFLDAPDREDDSFFFVYYIARLYKITGQLSFEPESVPFKALLCAEVIRGLSLVLENILECKFSHPHPPKTYTLGELLEQYEPLFQSSVVGAGKKVVQIINDHRRNDLPALLKQILAGTYTLSDGRKLTLTQCDLAISYALRNFSGHEISSAIFLSSEFAALSRHLLFAVFKVIEVQY